MKKTVRAWEQMVIGTIVFFVSVIGILGMYFSSDFLPVYDGALVPRVIRYGLYAVLGFNTFFAAYAASEGGKYLIRKFKKRKRRYYR